MSCLNDIELHRLNLERSIIGAVLLENCYGRIGRFLSSKNFLNEDHKRIWRVIEELWPTNPIDLLTVNHKLRTSLKVNLSYNLSLCTSKVNSAANVEYHALCLLEIDIREKLLKKLRNAASTEKDSLVKTSIHEIWIEIHNNPSMIFSILREAGEFLERLNPELQITKEIIEYNDLTLNGLKLIKYNSEVRTLINNLTRLGSGDSKRDTAVSYLTDVLLLVINSSAISDQLMNRITAIKKDIAA